MDKSLKKDHKTDNTFNSARFVKYVLMLDINRVVLNIQSFTLSLCVRSVSPVSLSSGREMQPSEDDI